MGTGSSSSARPASAGAGPRAPIIPSNRRGRRPPGRVVAWPGWRSPADGGQGLRQHPGGGRPHAAGAPQPRDPRHPHPRLRQGRAAEPRGLGEGPHRDRDHRGRGEKRRAEARRHHRGGHQRQHRRRPRPRRRHQGLPLHLHHPGQDVGGEGAAAPGPGRGGDRRPHRGAARAPRVLHHQGAQHRREHAELDHGRPALQPRQPRGALPDDGARDLGSDGGTGHPLRLLAGNRRHRLRRRPLPEGEEPEGEDRGRRSRGLDLHRVREDAQEGRRVPLQGRGHRRRQDPDLAALRRRSTSGCS